MKTNGYGNPQNMLLEYSPVLISRARDGSCFKTPNNTFPLPAHLPLALSSPSKFSLADIVATRQYFYAFSFALMLTDALVRLIYTVIKHFGYQLGPNKFLT